MSKLRDPTAKQNSILAIVAQRPGIHKSEICRSLGLSWGTLSYHLRRLKARGEMVIVASGRETRLFPPRIPQAQFQMLARLHNPVDAAIIGQLSGAPTLRADDLSANLGLSLQVIRRHLATLVHEGLVTPDGDYARRFQLVPSTSVPRIPLGSEGLAPPRDLPLRELPLR